MSTLQARITAAASWSSTSASNRCSSVAYSWCRSLASARARWSDCSRLRENVGIRFSSLLVASAVARSPRDPCSRTHVLVPSCTSHFSHQPSDRSLGRRRPPCDTIIRQVTGWVSFLLHHALQRMLVFSRKVHHLRHFSFCDLVSVNSALAYAMVMN